MHVNARLSEVSIHIVSHLVKYLQKVKHQARQLLLSSGEFKST